jgi:4-amino-4-deoxy-L-arabinose transferase-like glycosyltransferase
MALRNSISARGLLAVLVLVVTAVLWLATRWGIGLYTDSIVYIGAARSILAGDGFQFLNDIGQLSPITQYPPGYSWLIAAFAWTGLDALDAARWVSLVFCAGNSLIVAYIACRSTSSYSATLLAALLSFAAFPMVYVNSQALSEPPFIFLTLLGFCFLARYLQESHNASIYWFALAIGLSCLVRYVGIAFGMTGAAVILFHGRADWRKRFIDAAAFSVLSVLPIVAWVARNYFSAGNAVNRTFGFHLPALVDLLPSIDTVGHWLLPTSIVDNAPWPSRLFLLLVFLFFCGLARKVDWSRSWYPRLMVYCVVGYGGFLFISFSFNDQPLYFDTRTMALPYVAAMIVALSIMTEWLRKNRSREKSWRWFGFDCAMAVFLALQLINGVVWLRLSYLSGIGFATETWRQSELLKFAKNAPASTPIVSNAPDFIFTLTGRRAAMIPYKVDPNNRQPNKLFAQAIAAMREQLKQPNAVFVYFNDDQRLWYLPSIEELETNLPLEKIKTVSEGAIYGLRAESGTAAK